MFSFGLRNRFSKSTELAIIYFIICIGIAALDSIWAIYFNSFGLSESTIGYISGTIVFISLLFSFFSTPIMQKYSKIKIIFYSLLICAISYLIIYFYYNIILFVILALIINIAYTLRINSYDITFRDNTETNELNKQEGIYYSLINLSWLLGPLIGGYILLKFDIKSVFLFATVSVIIGLIIFLTLKLKDTKKEIEKYDYNFIKNIIDYFKDKERIVAYVMSFGIYAWFGMIYIYAPLFLINKGISIGFIGLFFALICAPTLMTEYIVGKLSEKLGFKFFFILGYAGLMITSILLFIIPQVKLQIALLIMSGFFIAFLEPLQDSYFFKNTKTNEEEKYYPIYATATHVGNVISKIIIATILLFFADDFAYLGMAVLFGILLIFAINIKNDFKKSF